VTGGALGDFFRVLAELGPRDPETLAAMREMLGLGQAPTLGEAFASAGPWLPPPRAPPTIFPPLAPVVTSPGRDTVAKAAGSAPPAVAAVLTRTATGGARPKPPDWVISGEAEPPAAPIERPEITPLIGGLTQPAILTAMLAAPAPEGDVDLDRVLDMIALDEELDAIPRLPIFTLRFGVQLLMDVGRGIAPFAPDQKAFVDGLSRLVPNERIEILRFVGCPSRGCGAGPRSSWDAWRPPAARTPVLAITDLGLGGSILDDEGGAPQEWLDFAARVKAAGCPFSALVPYAADRWPPRLSGAVEILHWSERTTARQAAHARRRRR